MPRRYNPRIPSLIKKAYAVACADNGFVIAIHILSFLCTFFAFRGLLNRDIGNFSLLSLIVSVFNIVNFSVIVFRIAGINKNIKYDLLSCYRHALRRLPAVMLLYILAGLLFLTVSSQMDFALLFLCALALLPLGIIVSCFTVIEEYGPIRAIHATLNLVKDKIGLTLFLRLSALYCAPIAMIAAVASYQVLPLCALLMQIWLLFCYIMTITIYSEATNKTVKVPKNVKIIAA